MQEHIQLSAAELAAIRVSGVFLVWAIIQTTHDAIRGRVKALAKMAWKWMKRWTYYLLMFVLAGAALGGIVLAWQHLSPLIVATAFVFGMAIARSAGWLNRWVC